MDNLDPSMQTDESSDVPGFESELGDHEWLARLREADRPAVLGRIGEYELVDEISRGAQGVVYHARQPHTNRDIAVKRLAAGRFASSTMRARFAREIETAASLNHANIVTVYGLETVDQQPLLAMEWIDGVPIDQWVRDSSGTRRPVVVILGLFLKVCDAIRHAHQRGVIHRDLKPSNILVDGLDQPHVLDFGLAKLTCEDQAGAALLTRSTDFVGTPAFASPEQARGAHDEVDTRSDIYALGVLLFKCLTGTLPFGYNKGLHDLLDQIQQAEPPMPSSIDGGLDRELDAIVLKALAKDPGQRYQSVDALADDLRRYLAGEAVQAHPPSAWYQLRKVVRRHRLPLAFASVLLALIVGASALTAGLALQLQDERDAATAAREQESTARAAAEEVTGFLQTMLSAADPQRVPDRDLTVAAVLDQAATQIESGTIESPLVEAAVRKTIGDAYRGLGRYDAAALHLDAALGLYEAEPDGGAAEFVSCLQALGHLYQDVGRHGQAQETYLRALALQRDDPQADPRRLATTLHGLGIAYAQVNQLDQATPLVEEALSIQQELDGPDHPHTLGVEVGLGLILFQQHRLAEAEAILRRVVDVGGGSLDDGHPTVMQALSGLSLVLKGQGHLEEARPFSERFAAAAAKVYGPEHPHAIQAAVNLGSLLQALDRIDEAVKLYRETLDSARMHLGKDHPVTLSAANNLASLLHGLEQYDEAEQLYREALEAGRRVFGDDDPHTAVTMGSLAALLRDAVGTDAAYAEAEALLLETLDIIEAKLPPNHPFRSKTLNHLRQLYGPDAMDDPQKLAELPIPDAEQ